MQVESQAQMSQRQITGRSLAIIQDGRIEIELDILATG
jgi:hypothetical protein